MSALLDLPCTLEFSVNSSFLFKKIVYINFFLKIIAHSLHAASVLSTHISVLTYDCEELSLSWHSFSTAYSTKSLMPA